MMDELRGATDDETAEDGPASWAFAADSEWARVCSLCLSPSICLSSIAVPLCHIADLLPPRFTRYCQALIGLPEKGSKIHSPPALRQQRDLLPLPFSELCIDHLMRDSGGGSSADFRASRRAWLFVMVSTLNYHWGLGGAKGATGVVFGPPSSIQMSALLKLVGAADAMIRLSPSQLGAVDWADEVGKAGDSYEGDSVQVAQGLVPALIFPALPTRGSLEPWRLLHF